MVPITEKARFPIFLATALCMNAIGGESLSNHNLAGGDLPRLADPHPGKPDFIFKIQDTLSVLFQSYLEYQSAPPFAFPCDGRVKQGLEEMPLAPGYAERCKFDSLWIFSKREVVPVPYPIRFIIDTTDECYPYLRFRIRHAPVAEPLFISTWKGKGPFLSPKPVKAKPKGLTRPPEAKTFAVKTYAYPGDTSLTLSVVHFRHMLPAFDDGYGSLPEREATAGRLYLNRGDKSYFLSGSYNFEKSDLAGFMDVNGDGELDILVGDPVELILERFEDGYRLWWWPEPPSHGC